MISFGDTRLPSRFWSKVHPCPMSGCWLWTAVVALNGYAQFSVHRRMALAHRHAFLVLVGPIAAGLEIDHLCRVRCCVNPAHLEAVTKAINVARGEACPPVHVGEKHHNAARSDADVALARQLRSEGWTTTAIAERFHVGQSTASRWCLGQVRRGREAAG